MCDVRAASRINQIFLFGKFFGDKNGAVPQYFAFSMLIT